MTYIVSNSPYIVVNQGGHMGPYINAMQPMSGMVRYANNRLEVYDGTSWLPMTQGATTVDFSSEAASVMAWARNKMVEEQQLEELCKKYPALQKAKDNYELILNLVKDENEKAI